MLCAAINLRTKGYKGTTSHEAFQCSCHSRTISTDHYGNADSVALLDASDAFTLLRRFALAELRELSNLTGVQPNMAELMSLIPLNNAHAYQDQRTSPNYPIF